MQRELLFQIVILISNILQTITGFAGTLLAMPFSMHLVGVERAKAVLNIFTLLACLWIAVQNRKHIRFRTLRKILVGMFGGMAVGIILFQLLPVSFLTYVYAVLIILIALKKMFIKREIRVPGFLSIVVLVGAGMIHGMFLSGGALLVVYALQVIPEKEEFRATVASVWVVLNALLIPIHWQLGYYTPECLMDIAWSLIPLVISITIGTWLAKRISQKTFMNITYILLLIAGGSLLL